jgi:hypothetical protein
MSDQYGGGPAGDPSREPERPAPYQGPGIFGPGARQQPPAGRQPGGSSPYGGPGPYNGPGPFGQPPNPYAYQPVLSAPPKQVTIAAAISFGLGGLCVLLGLLTLTSAGEEVAATLTGRRDAQGLVVGVVLACGVAYILPAIFLRKRRPWARMMLIVVAAVGIMGGVTALPGSIVGLALHVTLLVLMLQQPTRTWFHDLRR